jgi:hypothetical protein
MDFAIFVKITLKLKTMTVALYDQNYVLNEENIMLGIYLYDKHNIKEVLFVIYFYFCS